MSDLAPYLKSHWTSEAEYTDFRQALKHSPNWLSKAFLLKLDAFEDGNHLGDFLRRNPLQALQQERLDLTEEERIELASLPGFLGRRTLLSTGLGLIAASAATQAATHIASLNDQSPPTPEEAKLQHSGKRAAALVASTGAIATLTSATVDSMTMLAITSDSIEDIHRYLFALNQCLRQELCRKTAGMAL